ncbi:MAG TPA: hypothetical protein VFF81_09600 [Noviherbaspirillum sp.]|nr:hypothetical protein [Noviherbaspirillum sp.]
MNLARMMTDKFFIEDQYGVRSGPFKTKFGSGALMVFLDELRITEGDHIIRPMADGSERAYRVDGCSHNAGSRNIPAHYSIKISEAIATQAASAHIVMECQHLPSGEVHTNRPALAASMQSLAQAIDESAFPAEQKDEAKAILRKLLEDPVVAAVLADTDRRG